MGISEIKGKAVFLDRDGVINRSKIIRGNPYPPDNLSELYIFPDVFSCTTRLKDLGFQLIVVTNQPDVFRGKTTKENVNKINEYLIKKLPLDEIIVCFHDDIHNCECRKPLPGMLVSAAKKKSIDLKKSFMIGDRWKDILAGTDAGCKTILMRSNHKEKLNDIIPDVVVKSFEEATNWIIDNGN